MSHEQLNARNMQVEESRRHNSIRQTRGIGLSIYVQRIISFFVLLLLPICAGARPFLYVGNLGDRSLSVSDIATGQIIATVPVGDGGPVGIAANPAGTRLYVANGHDNTVSVVDTISNTIVATFPVQVFPVAIAVNPAGTAVYVTNSSSDTVSVIATSNNAVIATIPVSHGPQGIAIHPSGKWIYSLATNDQYVSVIDADSNLVVETFRVGNNPWFAIFNADASLMYVSGSGAIYIVDTLTNKVTRTIAAASLGVEGIDQIVTSPQGDVLYAHATNGSLTNDSVLILDPQSFAVVNRIPVGLHGLHLALDPSGTRLYVSNQGDDNVSVIDTGTQKVIATIAARSNPRPMVIVDVPPLPPTVSVIEYYNAPLDHYFMTALTSDINLLDGGAFAGWERTQQTFLAYRAQSSSALGPVCRFYIPPQHGDSHFFSALPAECAFLVLAAADPTHFPNFSGYSEEGAAAFFVTLPDATGACPTGTVPVFRLWNQRFDSNHRYTTNPAIVAQMQARNYVLEGASPNHAAMCAPM